ncbi:MAG: hypothetical protein IT582_04100, partial [Opitutaceae bacterium]|nr:hypothetical protein [Opitutaceae bacterium]
MSTWWQHCRRGGLLCLRGVGELGCWTLWLVLSLLLAFQLFIMVGRELPVPNFLLRSLEQRLESAGLNISFGHATFDPTGQVLVEDLQLIAPTFGEPIATARAVSLQLDPWALFDGRFEPSLIRASGVDLRIPAMLSESGASETLLSRGDVMIVPKGNTLELPQLTADFFGVAVSASGAIDLGGLPRATGDTPPLMRYLTSHYADICRRLALTRKHLAGLREGRVELGFAPSSKLGAIVTLNLDGRGYVFAGNPAFSIGPFRAGTRMPLWQRKPFIARITAVAEGLALPKDIRAGAVRATVRARLDWDKMAFIARRAELEIDRLTAQGVTTSTLSGELRFDRWPETNINAIARVEAEPIHLHGTINPITERASLRVAGRFDPALMNIISRRVGRDLRPFIDFGLAPEFDLALETGPAWTAPVLDGTVAARQVHAYHVTFDRIGGHVRVADGKFFGTAASAAIGTNFATGSYTHDFATHDFRFLLTGQLRPLDIRGWFHDWWPNFWDNLDFTAAAPDASVDVQGRWGHGDRTSVFVFAEAANPVINGAPLDHVTTLIYLRPYFYDAQQVSVRQGAGLAEGWFVRRHDPVTHELRRMDFDFNSTLPLDAVARLVGPEVAEVVAPFHFSTPLTLSAMGYVGGVGAAQPDRHIELHGQTQGEFTFQGFPLQGLNFSATDHNGDILIEPVSAGFALGTVSGRIRIQGPAQARMLGFDLGLKQGKLHQATGVLTAYFAKKRGTAATATTTSVAPNANVVMDLDVSAEGLLDDPLSYTGSGNA